MSNKFWTREEEIYIIENRHLNCRELRTRIQRSCGSIGMKKKRLEQNNWKPTITVEQNMKIKYSDIDMFDGDDQARIQCHWDWLPEIQAKMKREEPYGRIGS